MNKKYLSSIEFVGWCRRAEIDISCELSKVSDIVIIYLKKMYIYYLFINIFVLTFLCLFKPQ